MTFENAKKLHNGDEVSVKVTGEIVTVLQAYQLEDKKHIAIECDNGYTYYNDEVRQTVHFKGDDQMARFERKYDYYTCKKCDASIRIPVKFQHEGDVTCPICKSVLSRNWINRKEMYVGLFKEVSRGWFLA